MPVPALSRLLAALLFAAGLVAAIAITLSGLCLRRPCVGTASPGRRGGRQPARRGWRKRPAKEARHWRARLRLQRSDPPASGGGEGGGEGGTAAPGLRLQALKEPAGTRRSRIPLQVRGQVPLPRTDPPGE